jgi:hypothetical protein
MSNFVGTLNGAMKVCVANATNSNSVVATTGYVSNTVIDAGCFYTPYIPLMILGGITVEIEEFDSEAFVFRLTMSNGELMPKAQEAREWVEKNISKDDVFITTKLKELYPWVPGSHSKMDFKTRYGKVSVSASAMAYHNSYTYVEFAYKKDAALFKLFWL